MEHFLGKYIIVRATGVGTFAGILESFDAANSVAILREARRLWQWQGANTLSCLATVGTKNPSGCKFPTPVPKVLITSVLEFYLCTDAGRKSIEGVPVWKS